MDTVSPEQLAVDSTRIVAEMAKVTDVAESQTRGSALSARGDVMVDEVDSRVEEVALFR